jgi:cytochrome c5
MAARWLVMLGLSALACGPTRPPIPDAATLAPTGSACPPESTLTYESFGRAFFEEYCQTCHASTVRGGARQGAPRSHTYDDRAMILAEREEIDLRAAAGPEAINEDMPRTYPVPSTSEREQLGEWLACGAP